MSKFSKKENDLCDMLAWLACHADEDCPGEYRTKHFRIALKKAVDYLEDSAARQRQNNEQASGPTDGQDLSWPLALVSGPGPELQATSCKLQASSSKLDKTTLQ